MERYQTSVPGLYLVSEVISPQEEKELLNLISDSSWGRNRRNTRDIQISGPYHDRNYKPIYKNNKLLYSPHPLYIRMTASYVQRLRRLLDLKIDWSDLGNDKKCEVFLNAYNKDDGLRPHFDHRSNYLEPILGLSLHSDCVMTWLKGKTEVQVKVPARSVYVMTGASRYQYKHSIKAGDIFGRRISMTFRSLKLKN